MVAEALLGAALVLFELVAHDASMKRALSVGLHLVNTFFLLGATALTAWIASGYSAAAPSAINARFSLGARNVPRGPAAGRRERGRMTVPWETPSSRLRLSPQASRRTSRQAHTSLCVSAHCTLLLAATTALAVVDRDGAGSTRFGRHGRCGRCLAQPSWWSSCRWGRGYLSVTLLAPVWLQMVHLMLADCALDLARPSRGAAALAEAPRTRTLAGQSRERPRRDDRPVGPRIHLSVTRGRRHGFIGSASKLDTVSRWLAALLQLTERLSAEESH